MLPRLVLAGLLVLGAGIAIAGPWNASPGEIKPSGAASAPSCSDNITGNVNSSGNTALTCQ